jgi:hypothetical protein
MDLFTKLSGDFLVFVYHCFDRIVIRGYLTALSRPELVVHFFRGRCHIAVRRARENYALRIFKPPRRPHAMWSSPRRVARGVI